MNEFRYESIVKSSGTAQIGKYTLAVMILRKDKFLFFDKIRLWFIAYRDKRPVIMLTAQHFHSLDKGSAHIFTDKCDIVTAFILAEPEPFSRLTRTVIPDVQAVVFFPYILFAVFFQLKAICHKELRKIYCFSTFYLFFGQFHWLSPWFFFCWLCSFC